MISEFKDYIYSSEDNKVLVNDGGIKFLEADGIGLQILDENNWEVFQYNKPNTAPSHYSNISLIDMYSNKEETLFLDEKVIDDTTYTYLLFLDSNKVKRIIYSYDVILIEEAHKFPVLIIGNILILLLMSFLYTFRITKPINRIVEKILNLSNGNYSRNKIKSGIYYDVEKCLNQLVDRLDNNNKKREKLEEMREEWISNISHDIKTPLTSIIGNAEIMADTEYEIDDEKYNDSNISFSYSDEEILLELDENLAKRVFINLIINAFVYNSNDVKININIQKNNDDNVNVSIEDNGKGVSEEELNNIFKRYYRGTNTNKKTEGLGLGMAIAHDIIKAHGADIKAISKLGKGLRIDIRFFIYK
jgi:signal transduction histidine kinase